MSEQLSELDSAESIECYDTNQTSNVGYVCVINANHREQRVHLQDGRTLHQLEGRRIDVQAF
uniref:Uncharacterized protein n=1 Tax=Anopheles dirus TaxID=7168 RepID=A0A182NWM2_9DIPT